MLKKIVLLSFVLMQSPFAKAMEEVPTENVSHKKAKTELSPEQQRLTKRRKEHLTKKLGKKIHLGEIDKAQTLLEQGADPNGSYSKGSSFEGWTFLMNAVWKNNTDICKLLLAHSANVNTMTSTGCTALQLATTHEICEILLDAQAAIDASDDDGNTALILRAQGRNKEIYEFLLTRGANKEIKNKEGLTAQDYWHQNAHRDSGDDCSIQ